MMALQKKRILGAVLWVVGRKVENSVDHVGVTFCIILSRKADFYSDHLNIK